MSRGRPPRIGADDIGRAVVELGFSHATFEQVAAALGVAPLTVYRHVGNRRGLMATGLEVAFAGREWPSHEGTWRAVLRRYGVATWHAWAEYPGAAAAAATGAFAPSFARLWVDVIDVLLAQGFDAAEATVACDLVFDLAAADHRGDPADATDEQVADVLATVERAWDTALAGRSDDSRRRLLAARAASQDAFGMTALQWFERRLDVVLDGIAARRDTGGTR